ncbi:YbhB/YbcL family Raf kinase inhibitor-like protein [Enterococcus sp. AZ072]|uniref:YbhB/YbcL family Raf kinase inhibitor-like protein n=1 Tax=unclassified Enterococcus TaxID=2608891 RepID=UPI003D29E4E1
MVKIVGTILIVLMLAVLLVRFNQNSDIHISEKYQPLSVSIPAFGSDSVIPKRYSGNGEDVSPEIQVSQLDREVVSITIIMDDIDHPLMGVYNHWVVWNLPPQQIIPEAIPQGKTVSGLSEAIQGVGYGKHRYRGPKPPFGSHRYKYHVFALNKKLKLDPAAKKEELMAAVEGHIIQYGSAIGSYPGK